MIDMVVLEKLCLTDNTGQTQQGCLLHGELDYGAPSTSTDPR